MSMHGGAPVLSADPALLEQRLCARIAAARAASGEHGTPGPTPSLPAPQLVVAPTQRILDRLSWVLGRTLGAAVGLHLHHHHSLAKAILARRPGVAPRELPAELLPGTLLRESPADALDGYLARHPAARDALLATFRDLRDAGLEDDAVPALRGLSATAARTLAHFQEFQRWMARAADRGFLDAAGLARRARQDAPGFLKPFAAAHHYGAYDLTGVHEDLMHAVQQGTPTTFWILGTGSGPEDSLPQRLARTFSSTRPEVLESGVPELSWVHAADPEAELRHALRRVLDWHDADGIPLGDLAVLTRNPSRYSLALRGECRRLGIPCLTNLHPPLRREPGAVRLRLLLELLQDPGQRAARERCFRFGGPELARESVVDGWIREWSTRSSTAHALHWIAARGEELAPELLGTPLEQLAATCDALEELLPRHAPGAALDLVLRWLDQEVVAEPDERIEGLTVLDLLQARGLPWRRAVCIGCNEGAFPRIVEEDAFLPDRDRRILAEALGRKIPLKSTAAAEERLLWDLVRGATAERLEISWARGDLRGRVLAPSPYVHELGEAARHAGAIPRHPRSELEHHCRELRLLTAEEALTLAALSGSAEAPSWAGLAGRLGLEQGSLERSLAMVALTESFTSSCTDHDGAFGARPATPWTATALALLGRCPLQFAFRHRLGIEPPDEPTDEAELTRLQFGILMHQVLEHLYTKLPPHPTPQQLDSSLREVWEAELSRLQDGRVPPELLAARSAAWCEELLRFVTADLQILEQEQLTLHSCEEQMELTLPVQGRAIPFRIRIDRVLRDPGGREWLGDYKTSSPNLLRQRARLRRALQGKDLQLVLYWLAREAAGHDVHALDYIAVAPRRRRDGALAPEDHYFRLLVSELLPHRDRLEDTLDALLEVERRGEFPLVSGSSPSIPSSDASCGTCGFRRACRHTHLPTVHRGEALPVHRRFYALRLKSERAAKDPVSS